MYKLSRVIQAHKRDVRCIDYFNGILVTGGNDKIFNMYTYNQGNYTLIATSDIFESEIISLKLNKNDPSSKHFALLGCRNGKIYCFDQEGNPSLEITHDNTISSLDFIDDEHFVSGSWDGKAIVWSFSTLKQVSEYNQHKYAVSVFYNKTNNYVVSGSQDKALNLWDWRTGQKIKRLQNAHEDIIRQISDVQGSGMIISCSNDEKLKIWSADLQFIQGLYGHTAFVFTVKAISLGLYISGGQDKTVKVWGQSEPLQSIQLPCSVWNVTFDQNLDIFVAGSDGFLRIFTQSEERKADQDVIQIFEKQIIESSAKKSGMSEEEIKKLMQTSQMKAMKGKKEGEIRVFRDGMVPEAYMWQQNKWVKIGDVITEGGSAEGGKTESKYYAGDKYFNAGTYDYLFDVDDQSGVPKVIPFNDGDNPMQAAERYCKRQGMGKGLIEQIRKFLLQNSSKVPKAAFKKQEEKEVSTGLLKSTPATSTIEYNDVKNPQALFNKLKEFNQKAQGKKLNQKELAHTERLVTLLQSSSTYHTWKLDFKEMDSLKKLLTWPKPLRFPVWDMLRAFLKHYQSQALFSGLQCGGDIITQLAVGLQTQQPESIYTLILKTYSNALIHNNNKGGMIKHAQTAFQSLLVISKRSQLQNANYLGAFSSLLYNYSIAFIEKKVQKEQTLVLFANLLHKRLQTDSNFDNRSLLLQAGANVLSKYHKSHGEHYHFLISYLQNDDPSHDIKLFF